VYPDVLLLALTDTFSTEAFFKAYIYVPCCYRHVTLVMQDFSCDPERARRWKGLRQDSGDPFLFAPRAKEVYESVGIDHKEKTIIFSDALNLDKALGLKKQCDELGFLCRRLVGFFASLQTDMFQAPSVSVHFSQMTSTRSRAVARRRAKR
jgi:nicotinate phosphoribosyltransferase